jgi:hypothetical protein
MFYSPSDPGTHTGFAEKVRSDLQQRWCDIRWYALKSDDIHADKYRVNDQCTILY